MTDIFDNRNDEQRKVNYVRQHVVDEQGIVRDGEKMHGQCAPATAATALPVSSTRFLAPSTTSFKAASADW